MRASDPAARRITWSGSYYGSQTPRREPVTITITATGLRLVGEHGHTRFWPYEELKQAQGVYAHEPVRLERGDDLPEALVVDDQAFLAAIHHVAPHVRSRLSNPVRRRARRRIAAIATTALLLVGSAFYLWGLPALAARVARAVPPAWEERLGHDLVQDLAPPERRCTDPAQQRAVEQLAAALLAPAPETPYTFRLAVMDDSLVNAFAAPGGYIVIFRGLMERTERPEELAGVLAHEMQHVLLQHSTQGLLRDVPMRLLLGVVTGDAAALGLALRAAGTLGSLRFRRNDERAADREGMKMLLAAGMDPAGMIDFFDQLPSAGPDIPAYLSTHPPTADRLEALRRMAAEAGYTPVPVELESDWAEITASCHDAP